MMVGQRPWILKPDLLDWWQKTINKPLTVDRMDTDKFLLNLVIIPFRLCNRVSRKITVVKGSLECRDDLRDFLKPKTVLVMPFFFWSQT